MTNHAAEIIGIIGGVIAFLLAVNAYYFKDILGRLLKIELQLVKLLTEHKAIFKLVEKHDDEIEALEKRIQNLEVLHGRQN